MIEMGNHPVWSEQGYSAGELEGAQEKFGLRFPPDLVEFLRRRRPYCVGEGFFDWVHSPEHEIRQLLVWPFNGFWFDVQHNGVWWSDWGPKPDSPVKQLARLREVFRDVPRLIPVFGRRYLPEAPNQPGNPVFSVYQTDVTCYGQDLEDWVRVEFERGEPPKGPPEREIAFWSEAVRRNEAAG